MSQDKRFMTKVPGTYTYVESSFEPLLRNGKFTLSRWGVEALGDPKMVRVTVEAITNAEYEEETK